MLQIQGDYSEFNSKARMPAYLFMVICQIEDFYQDQKLFAFDFPVAFIIRHDLLCIELLESSYGQPLEG